MGEHWEHDLYAKGRASGIMVFRRYQFRLLINIIVDGTEHQCRYVMGLSFGLGGRKAGPFPFSVRPALVRE